MQKVQILLLCIFTASGILFAYRYVRNKSRGAASLSAQDVIAEMRSRADLAVHDAKTQFNSELDFSPESVEAVESILSQIHQSHAASPIADAELNRQALKWGAYVGEVIKRIRASEWRLDSKFGGEGSLPIVYENDGESFPVRWCYKRIVKGNEENVWHKFTLLVVNRDTGPTGMTPNGRTSD